MQDCCMKSWKLKLKIMKEAGVVLKDCQEEILKNYLAFLGSKNYITNGEIKKCRAKALEIYNSI